MQKLASSGGSALGKARESRWGIRQELDPLRETPAGVDYRRKMCLDGRAGTTAQWESTVEATIIDDDWVQIVPGTAERLGIQDAGMMTTEAGSTTAADAFAAPSTSDTEPDDSEHRIVIHEHVPLRGEPLQGHPEVARHVGADGLVDISAMLWTAPTDATAATLMALAASPDPRHRQIFALLRTFTSQQGPVDSTSLIAQLTVINKDLLIATLTDDVPFEIEMVVENGRGYVPATEHSPNTQEIGIIPVDAVFSPVTRVRYDVEETRIGQKTNYDKLTMEIWTNGTVSAEMALVEAAKILRKHLNPFVGYTQPGLKVTTAAVDVLTLEAPLESRLGMLLSDLKLSVRASNCLESEGIGSLRDLVSRTEEELMEMRNFGDTTLLEIKSRLTEVGLRLGMSMPASAEA